MSTAWKRIKGNESDRGFLTDDTGTVLADNTLNKILFHTGIFVKSKTQWKGKSKPNPTIWTKSI